MPKKQTKAETVVEAILGDLSDRSGLSNAWDEIDESVQKEIKAAWIELVEDRYGADDDDDSPGLTDPSDGDDGDDGGVDLDDDDEDEED